MSCPELSVPPSSLTWNVKLEIDAPLALAAAVQVSLPAVTSAMEISWLVNIAAPFSRITPVVGNVVMKTEVKAFGAGASVASAKPKSAAVRA